MSTPEPPVLVSAKPWRWRGRYRRWYSAAARALDSCPDFAKMFVCQAALAVDEMASPPLDLWTTPQLVEFHQWASLLDGWDDGRFVPFLLTNPRKMSAALTGDPLAVEKAMEKLMRDPIP